MSDPSATGATDEIAALRSRLARTTEELEVRSAEADVARRTRSEFLATMSHELRTPLNAVIGYAQLLDMGVLGPATPEQQAHLARLQASARHLLRLVDDLLDVAKVDADRLQVRRDVLVTGAAVSAAVALVQPEAAARGVRLVDAGADVVGFAYLGDEHRVRQILVNLLTNAVKFTPPGGTITVDCGMATPDDEGPDDELAADAGDDARWALIRVRDTGPGVPFEMRDHIFEPFVQGESGLTREQGGTGLGLAISRRLARLMGGDLTVRSAVSGGATFTLWLPTPPREQTAPAAPVQVRRRTPTLGVPAASDTGLSATAYAVLVAIGARLSTDNEAIALRYVAALRADPAFPGARTLPVAQLRDHFTTVVVQLAAQIMTIGETHGRAPELLADSGQVQRLMAELHGVQRHRLGWSEADIIRELPIMVEEVQRSIRGALASAPVPLPEAGEVDSAAAQAALNYALDLTHHILERSQLGSLRSFRFAATADSR